jgi:hypothetical protein
MARCGSNCGRIADHAWSGALVRDHPAPGVGHDQRVDTSGRPVSPDFVPHITARIARGQSHQFGWVDPHRYMESASDS